MLLIGIPAEQQAGYAAPGNVFLTAAPAQAPSSDDQRVSEEASHEIDESGAAHYTIPITVPPGRQGLQPKLSLSYSSRNPIRGGIAVGWSLSIPRIELDTSQGLLPGMPAAPTDPRTSTTAFYRSSLSGTRLVRVPEATTDGAEAYRAEFDTTYARYERVKDPDRRTRMWHMRTTDGRTWYFGDGPRANEFGSSTVAGRSFLSRVVDKFGNSMDYSYLTAFGRGPVRYSFIGGRADTYLSMIEWGKNENAGLPHHARARFEYTEAKVGIGGGLCPDSNVPIGANFTYRLGYPLYEGAMRLDRIKLEVLEGPDKWREVRRYELSYDRTELSCPTETNHAPLRLLISVREIATDPILKTEATVPYVFEYGRRELELTKNDSTGRSFGSGQNQGSPAKAGAWPTLISMLLDLNGDGLLDGISAVDEPVTTHCNVSTVYGVLKLPIVPWANGGPGQFGIRNNQAPEYKQPDMDFLNTREGCSASHQFSRVLGRVVQDGHGERILEGWVPKGEEAGSPATYLSYRFMDVTGDGRPDLVTAIDSNRGKYRPESDRRLTLQPQPPPVDYDPRTPMMDNREPWVITHPSSATCWDPGSVCPVGAEADHKKYLQDEEQQKKWVKPEQGPNNSFLFRVYENTGSGFSAEPKIVYSPVPLETDRGTSNLGAGPQALGSMYHGFLDIDGDGLLDAISNGGDYLTGEGNYQNKFDVFRGDGTGSFRSKIDWAAPGLGGSAKVKLQVSHGDEVLGMNHTTSSATQVVMRDLNGDGLPDYISSDPAVSGTDQVRVFYNTGRGFVSRENYAGERLDTAAWTTDDKYPAAFWNTYKSFDVNSTLTLQLVDSLGSSDGQPKKQVWSRAITQIIDIDMDGLPDMVRIQHPDPSRTNPFTLAPSTLSPNTGEPKPVTRLFINAGDKLVPMGETQMTRDIWQALARITIGATDGPWAVWTDFIDHDGDGLPEATVVRSTDQCTPEPTTGLIDYQCFSSVSTYATKNEDPKDQQGLRLLRTVKNGRGGSVQFHYQPWDRNTGGRVPYPLWVVSRVTVNAGPDALGAPSPNQVTAYSYKQAVYNQDAHGDWGFRGFSSIGKTNHNADPTKPGAFTETIYDYSLHWGGLPVAVRIFDATNGHPHKITKTLWGRNTLFTTNSFTGNVPILTYHRREVEQRTCGSKQNLEDCEANGAARFDTYKHVAVASSPTAVPALFVETMHWVGEQKDVNQPGTRWREVTPLLISIPNDYRLITTEKTRWVMGEQPLLVGRTHHVFDKLTRRFELETHEYVDEATVAKTVRTYDEMTGNMKTVTQPNEAVKATRRMSRFEYDARKLFVVKTTNELDHVVEASYDLGTGSQLTSRGPNAKNSVKEGWERKFDGFGRVREEWVYLDHPTAGYARVLMQRNFYHDAPVLNGHAGTIVWKRIEIDEDRWMQTLTEVDGLGRVLATTLSNATGEPILAVSRYRYDAAGNLAQADLPSPTESTGPATVPYLLTFDTQGRPTSALRPDGTGQGWTYDGRSTTREDVIANKGGMVSRTRTLTDAWDRIVETDEQVTDSKWGATRYQYDGNDNVRHITNADNLVTEMNHDWLSQRLQIRRGQQIWRYSYDLNGNMISIQAPMPSGALETHYTTSIKYDTLDRPILRQAGRRAVPSDKLALYGLVDPNDSDGTIIPTQYKYDENPNGIGRLSSVSESNGKTIFTYDARGLVTSEEGSFTILNNQFFGKRKTLRTYNALEQPHTITYPDGLTPTEPTTVQYTYDDRGLPSRVDWVGHSELGRATYTAAGGLATRGGPLSATTTHQLTNTYDDLGRMVRQHATTLTSGQQATLLDQRLAYTGSDDVGSMNTTLGVTPQPVLVGWNFTYDKQHQLIRAAGPLNYLATFSYSPAGRILSTDVNAAPEAARVHRRKVSYDYGLTTGPGDLEAPDRLFDATTNAAWMTMEYDPAGNVTQRTIQGQPNSWTHAYDGADLQREVVAPDEASELYWYNHERQRTLIVTKSATGTVERVRWVLDETEIWYDGTGEIVKTITTVPFKGTFARIEDRTKAQLLFNNSRGDILLALDQMRTSPAAEFAYGPYGESIRESGTGMANVLERFNGKQFDVASGLSYYGYRYYDERSLTWTQSDPLYRFAPDINKIQPRTLTAYGFSLNNPLRYMDPDGREPKDFDSSYKASMVGIKANALKVAVTNSSGGKSGELTVVSVKLTSSPTGQIEGEIKAIEAKANTSVGTIKQSFLKASVNFGPKGAGAKAVVHETSLESTVPIGDVAVTGGASVGLGIGAAGGATEKGIKVELMLGVVGLKLEIEVGGAEQLTADIDMASQETDATYATQFSQESLPPDSIPRTEKKRNGMQ